MDFFDKEDIEFRIGNDGLCDFLVFLASSEKAVTFIPFIVDLAAEFGMLRKIYIESLSVVFLDIAIITKRFNKQPSMKLVEESLSIKQEKLSRLVNVFSCIDLNKRIYPSLKEEFDSYPIGIPPY